MAQQPSFLDWLAALPWWAKMIIGFGTAAGIWVSVGPLFSGG